jgi:hypothetical protein
LTTSQRGKYKTSGILLIVCQLAGTHYLNMAQKKIKSSKFGDFVQFFLKNLLYHVALDIYFLVAVMQQFANKKILIMHRCEVLTKYTRKILSMLHNLKAFFYTSCTCPTCHLLVSTWTSNLVRICVDSGGLCCPPPLGMVGTQYKNASKSHFSTFHVLPNA